MTIFEEEEDDDDADDDDGDDDDYYDGAAFHSPPSRQLQKILLSATLSSNPERLEKLHLVSPTYYVTSTQHLYALPTELKVNRGRK